MPHYQKLINAPMYQSIPSRSLCGFARSTVYGRSRDGHGVGTVLNLSAACSSITSYQTGRRLLRGILLRARCFYRCLWHAAPTYFGWLCSVVMRIGNSGVPHPLVIYCRCPLRWSVCDITPATTICHPRGGRGGVWEGGVK